MTNEEHYVDHTDVAITKQDMEALAANAEQDWDIDQVIRHNLYIGWIMGLANGADVTAIRHGGGNRVLINLSNEASLTLIVPYPPQDWQP
jgi:hypothetical protein